MSCQLCPRHCNIDRTGRQGYCHAGDEIEVSAVCRHLGEEPPLVGSRGICNVFFTHCNLQCVYCQNFEISRHPVSPDRVTLRGIEAVADSVCSVLADSENMLGLVSATHYADQIPALIDAVHRRGLHPTVVYNSGGYESVETLRALEPYIAIYLPDYKYSYSDLSARLSQAPDYPQRAAETLCEMYRQKGSSLHTDEAGLAFGGLIVRHLVLPGAVDNSLRCLDWLAENLSTRIHLSLMAQYYPPAIPLDKAAVAADDPLRRTLHDDEYQQVVEHMQQLGFYNGWVQPLSASDNYQPHFNSSTPFR